MALGLEFDGSLWRGWQFQGHDPQTLQQVLQQALSQIAAEPVHLEAAGRTDAGVHATGMVAHFDSKAVRPMRAWVQGTNTCLPDSVAVQWAQEVPADFHARFKAEARRYRYLIYNHPTRPALGRWQMTWHYAPLDVERMAAAAQVLVGRHDFSAFRAAQCQSRQPVRQVEHLTLQRRGRYILLDIQANGFLHHMVRNIVGVLLPVGEGRKPQEWVQTVLQSQDRRCAGLTAPAEGLYFVDVRYPPRFSLPQVPLGPALWA